MSFAKDSLLRTWRTSILVRISVVSATVSFLVLAASCFVLLLAISRETSWIDEQIMRKRADTLSELLTRDSYGQLWLGHEVSEDLEGPRRIFIRVLDPAGAVQFETPGMDLLLAPSIFPNVAKRPMGEFDKAWVDPKGDERFFTMAVRLPQAHDDGSRTLATVQIATDTSLDDLAIARYRGYLGWILTAALGLMIGSSFVVARHALRPVRRMTREVEAIDATTASARVDVATTPLELRDLGAKFNLVLDRLQAHQARLRGYADDVAHEIRSPLHTLMLETDVALLKDRSPDEYKAALAAQRAELQALSDLVDKLLMAARLEAGVDRITMGDVDLEPVIARAVAISAEEARKANVKVVVDCAHDAIARGDPVLLTTAISNLLRNAIAHSSPGLEVRILAAASPSGIAIHVIDQGEGIAPSHQQLIFDRFHRVDSSRDRTKGRVGLGLSIVQGVVHLHGGAIELESAVGKGAHFKITLPVALQNAFANDAKAFT